MWGCVQGYKWDYESHNANGVLVGNRATSYHVNMSSYLFAKANVNVVIITMPLAIRDIK